MKIKSLILGSVAAAGLSTGAMAADLGTVLTNLDVCDALGISGLTISSDTNCLQITGNVTYSFQWGDYAVDYWTVSNFDRTGLNGADQIWGGGIQDWDSDVDAWVQLVGTGDSSFGNASATIRFDYDEDNENDNGVITNTAALTLDRAFVSIGNTTVLTAGLRTETVALDGNDEPFNYLGLFNSSDVGTGVGNSTGIATAGNVIQVVADLGDGFAVRGALENLNGATVATAGTAIGVLEYSGDMVSAEATFMADGILNGAINNWAIHAGATANLDVFRIRGAAAFDSNGYWNILGTAEAEFDMFTLAVSGEAGRGNEIGVGGSIGADVTDGVTINLGARWFDSDTTVLNNETAEIGAQLVAEVTETITLTGNVGLISETNRPSDLIYFGGQMDWDPSEDFNMNVGVEANTLGIGTYRLFFGASKDFE